MLATIKLEHKALQRPFAWSCRQRSAEKSRPQEPAVVRVLYFSRRDTYAELAAPEPHVSQTFVLQVPLQEPVRPPPPMEAEQYTAAYASLALFCRGISAMQEVREATCLVVNSEQ